MGLEYFDDSYAQESSVILASGVREPPNNFAVLSGVVIGTPEPFGNFYCDGRHFYILYVPAYFFSN